MLAILIGVAGCWANAEVARAATTWFVAPGGPGSCASQSQSVPLGSLSAALGCATDGDRISLAAGSYSAPDAQTGVWAGSPVFEVSRSVSIVGAGARQTTLADTVVVDPGAQVSLSGVTVDTGGVEAGVLNFAGSVTIADSAIVGNSDNGPGAGAAAAGIESEANGPSGSGVYGDASLTVVDSTISGNSGRAGGSAGGVLVDYPQSGHHSTALIVNSTLAGNTGNRGTVFANTGTTVTLREDTISGNRAALAGGVDATSNAMVTLANTVLAANTAIGSSGAPDCQGSLADAPAGHNVVGVGCGSLANAVNGDQVGSSSSPLDAKLGVLQDNGGPTDTMALQPGSPAVGAGDPADCQQAPTSNQDQRGDARQADTRNVCDTGAYDTGGPVTVMTASLPAGQVGTPYTSSLAASGGFPSYHWSISAGQLPPGLTLAPSSGAVTGTPTAPGTYQFTAVVTDASGASAQRTIDQVVEQATTTGLVSSPNPSLSGQAVKLTATVRGPSGSTHTPAGTVTFSDGSTQLGTGTLDGSGTATLTVSALAVGSHRLSAAYGGDALDQPSGSSAVTQTVTAATPTPGPTPTPQPQPQPKPKPKPTLSGLSVSPHQISGAGRKVDGKCVAPTSKNKHRVRCRRSIKFTISYRLSAADAVTFTVTRVSGGRKVNGKCVAATKKNMGKPRCTRLVRVRGSVRQTGKAGADRFIFTGKIGGRNLAPGTYELTATPSGGKPTRVRFTILA